MYGAIIHEKCLDIVGEQSPLAPTWLQPGDKNLDLIIIGNQLIFPKFFFKPFKKFPLATTRSQYCFSKLFWHKLENSIAQKELGQTEMD
jgi:hypothetical protein